MATITGSTFSSSWPRSSTRKVKGRGSAVSGAYQKSWASSPRSQYHT
jgi:hypothetical protein